MATAPPSATASHRPALPPRRPLPPPALVLSVPAASQTAVPPSTRTSIVHVPSRSQSPSTRIDPVSPRSGRRCRGSGPTSLVRPRSESDPWNAIPCDPCYRLTIRCPGRSVRQLISHRRAAAGSDSVPGISGRPFGRNTPAPIRTVDGRFGNRRELATVFRWEQCQPHVARVITQIHPAGRSGRACRTREKALSASRPAVLYAAGVDAQNDPGYRRVLAARRSAPPSVAAAHE